MFKKSLNSILGSFAKVQSDLEIFIADSRTESSNLYAKANILEKQAYDLNKEADRAEVIVGNIKTLLND